MRSCCVCFLHFMNSYLLHGFSFICTLSFLFLLSFLPPLFSFVFVPSLYCAPCFLICLFFIIFTLPYLYYFTFSTFIHSLFHFAFSLIFFIFVLTAQCWRLAKLILSFFVTSRLSLSREALSLQLITNTNTIYTGLKK